MLVVVKVHVKRGEQRGSEILEVETVVHFPLADGRSQEPEYGRAAPIVGGVREALQPIRPAQRLVAAVEQGQVLRREAYEPVQEYGELLQCRRSGLAQQLERLLLQVPRWLVEERLAQIALVWEAPVECPLPDVGCPRYIFHSDAGDAALPEERPRRI